MIKSFIILLMILFSSPLLASEYVVSQGDKDFLLQGQLVDYLKIEIGDRIIFINEDPFYHSVFSSSETKRFDLGVFPQGESRSVSFDEVGVVEVECAIHPSMYLKIEVQRGSK